MIHDTGSRVSRDNTFIISNENVFFGDELAHNLIQLTTLSLFDIVIYVTVKGREYFQISGFLQCYESIRISD